ncbi:MAG: hydroxyacylglutathione hydrolase [Nevskiaceae bacterium]|nr:MAG: hydroxyacylglutathione hydrolase [Nevskiaceae bacterium]TBR74123.1 MAG: hydroxyacylglutathione hydrolase [Nevskiaceae bacterium]
MITRTPGATLRVERLPAFTDNYIWLIHDDTDAIVVDPGDAAVTIAALTRYGVKLRAILVTHHHPDHTGGVLALKARTGATVYAPAAEAGRIAGIDHAVTDGESLAFTAPALVGVQVLAVPGHTLGHVAYHDPANGWLFCGDTLFSGGCGRLFEGTAAQMYASLQRLAALPGDTQVYCAHEYTVANLRFAHALEPENPRVGAALANAEAQRSRGAATVPSTIQAERAINPFLRCDAATPTAAIEIFAARRRQKDAFTA